MPSSISPRPSGRSASQSVVRSGLEDLTEKEVDPVQIGIGELEFDTQSLSDRAELSWPGESSTTRGQMSGRNPEPDQSDHRSGDHAQPAERCCRCVRTGCARRVVPPMRGRGQQLLWLSAWRAGWCGPGRPTRDGAAVAAGAQRRPQLVREKLVYESGHGAGSSHLTPQ
jgi:hypothetical protein